MCYPCDRGIVLPICPGYTPPDPGMNPGAMIVRPSAAGSHKFVAHPKRCSPIQVALRVIAPPPIGTREKSVVD